jgi:hypothetical protein
MRFLKIKLEHFYTVIFETGITEDRVQFFFSLKAFLNESNLAFLLVHKSTCDLTFLSNI